MPDLSSPILVCQISDLHVDAAIDAAPTLNTARARTVIAHVAALTPRPDVVLLTGDLSDHGDVGSYHHLRALLGSLDMPVLPMVGNHDRRAAMAAVLGDVSQDRGFVQYDHWIGDRRIVLLDTLDEERGGGAFCAARAAWLDTQLRAAPDTPTLIALHHPPFAVGIDWMDPSPGAPWTARLLGVVEKHPQIVGFMAGHLHRPIATSWAGRPFVIASSVAPQLALDLRPTPVDAPDGRPLVTIEPPAFVLYRWIADAVVSHFVTVAPIPTLIGLDDRMALVLDSYMRENRGN